MSSNKSETPDELLWFKDKVGQWRRLFLKPTMRYLYQQYTHNYARLRVNFWYKYQTKLFRLKCFKDAYVRPETYKDYSALELFTLGL